MWNQFPHLRDESIKDKYGLTPLYKFYHVTTRPNTGRTYLWDESGSIYGVTQSLCEWWHNECAKSNVVFNIDEYNAIKQKHRLH